MQSRIRRDRLVLWRVPRPAYASLNDVASPPGAGTSFGSEDDSVEFLASLEQSTIGTIVRESLWAYPTLLVLHALGLAFVVGVNAAIDLRVLGVARDRKSVV